MDMKGTSEDMCPADEAKIRISHNLVNYFERSTDIHKKRKLDKSLLVKEYHRPAAGKETKTSELRTPETLLKTSHYLITKIAERNDRPWFQVYEFIFDRLRSIRQEIVIQRLETTLALEILQICVRFHVYSNYKLCDHSINEFDPKINTTHVTECISKSIELAEALNLPFKLREEMECINLLVNLENDKILRRALILRMKLRRESRSYEMFNKVLDITKSYASGNFYRFIKKGKSLPLIYLVCIHYHLHNIQKKVIDMFNTAFNLKRFSLPLSKFTSFLQLNHNDETETECKKFGFTIREGTIGLFMNNYNSSEKFSKRHWTIIEEELEKTNISDMLNGV